MSRFGGRFISSLRNIRAISGVHINSPARQCIGSAHTVCTITHIIHASDSHRRPGTSTNTKSNPNSTEQSRLTVNHCLDCCRTTVSPCTCGLRAPLLKTAPSPLLLLLLPLLSPLPLLRLRDLLVLRLPRLRGRRRHQPVEIRCCCWGRRLADVHAHLLQGRLVEDPVDIHVELGCRCSMCFGSRVVLLTAATVLQVAVLGQMRRRRPAAKSAELHISAGGFLRPNSNNCVALSSQKLVPLL